MEPVYKKSESMEKPSTIEVTEFYVFLRKDISEFTRSDITGSQLKYYAYSEATLTHDEFNEYIKILNARNMDSLISKNDQIIAQSTGIAVNSEYLVCMAEVNNK